MTEQLSRLSQNYTKLLPGVDLLELDADALGPETGSRYQTLAFAFGGGDTMDSTARRLSDILRPHKVRSDVSDFNVFGGGTESGGEAMVTGGDTARMREASSASSTLDPMECFGGSSVDSTGHRAVDRTRYASLIQSFFLLFRMLECFPDTEKEMDAIASRLLQITTKLEAKIPAVDPSRGRGGQRRGSFVFDGSGLVDIIAMKKNLGGVLVENEWMEELEEIYDYMQSSDLWNGPTRKDVSVYLTTDYIQECRLCAEERKERTLAGASLFLNYCDHLPACRSEQFGGGTLPIRRYILVLRADGWNQHELALRTKLAFWCLQSKLVPRDYGTHVVHPLTCSTYMARCEEQNEEEGAMRGPFFPMCEKGILLELATKGKLPYGPPMELRNHTIIDDSDLWYKTQNDDWRHMFDRYHPARGESGRLELHELLSHRTIKLMRKAESVSMMQLMKEEGYSAWPIDHDTAVYAERSLVDPSWSFLCGAEYLRDWPMLWKQHLPHYFAFISSGIRCLMPGFYDVTESVEAEETLVCTSRGQVRNTPNGSTTVHYNDDYMEPKATVGYQQRLVFGPKLEETRKRAFLKDALRPDHGIPGMLRVLLKRTMEYMERQYLMGQYLYTMRSDEANISDALRDIYARGGRNNYNPMQYMMEDSGPLPYYSNLSPYCNYHIKFVDDLKKYYQIDSYKVTFMHDFYRMLQDCFREKRALHINIALVTEEKPGVGKSFMTTMLSHLLLSGAVQEVGHQSDGAFRRQCLGRRNDSIIVRDEASKSIFMSKAEGHMADPRIKELLSNGYTKANILNWSVNPMQQQQQMQMMMMAGGCMPNQYQAVSFAQPNSLSMRSPSPVSPRESSPHSTKTSKRKAPVDPMKRTRRKKRRCAAAAPNADDQDSSQSNTLDDYTPHTPVHSSTPVTTFSPFLHQSHGAATDRKTVNYTYEEIGSWIANLNFSTKIGQLKDGAMASRLHTHVLTRSAQSEDGLRAPLSTIISQVPMSVCSQMKALQMAHMEIRKMIMFKAIKEPTLHMVEIVKSFITPIIRRHMGDSVCLERDFTRISALASIDCITRVVFSHFMVKGGMFYSKSITPTRLRSLEPFFYATFQDVVFAFGNFVSQIIPSVERYMLTVLRRIWCSGRTRENPFAWSQSRTLAEKRPKVVPTVQVSAVDASKEIPESSLVNQNAYGIRDDFDIESSLTKVPESLLSDDAGEQSAPPSAAYAQSSHHHTSSKVDYNYIVFRARGVNDPIPKFARLLHHEISIVMKENKVLNMSVPEVKEVETWLRGKVQRPVEDAKRMVPVAATEEAHELWREMVNGTTTTANTRRPADDNQGAGRKTNPGGTKRRKKRRATATMFTDPVHHSVGDDAEQDSRVPSIESVFNGCHPECVIPDENAPLHDIQCIVVVPKVGLYLSTYWLLKYVSVFEDIYTLLAELHAHNLRHSPDAKVDDGIAKVYHDLLLGSPDPWRFGRYEAVSVPSFMDDCRDSIVSKYGLKISRTYCPDGSIVAPPAGSPNRLPLPPQSLDDIVQRTRVKDVFMPCAQESAVASVESNDCILSNLDFVLCISFLVMDSQENRRRVMEAVKQFKNRATSSAMANFVIRTGASIPMPTLFSWHYRTRVPISQLRSLFPSYYFILLTSPFFQLDDACGIIKVAMTHSSHAPPSPNRLFNQNPNFYSHMSSFGISMTFLNDYVIGDNFDLGRNLFSEFYMFPAVATEGIARGYNVPASRCREHMRFSNDPDQQSTTSMSHRPYTKSYDAHYRTMAPSLDICGQPESPSCVIMDDDEDIVSMDSDGCLRNGASENASSAGAFTYQTRISNCLYYANENSKHADPIARKNAKYPAMQIHGAE